MDAARLTLCLGIFAVMALSNAIVPVLPVYSHSSFLSGAIYAAYFLGAMVTTLPAGILADCTGRGRLALAGLMITALSGGLLCAVTAPVPVILARGLEGTGAGLFVVAALSMVNSYPDHVRMSGYFMAMQNAGLVAGLATAGYLAAYYGRPFSGIVLFTILAAVAVAAAAFFTGRDCGSGAPAEQVPAIPVFSAAYPHVRVLYSAAILVGVTGVVTSLYPQFSGLTPFDCGIWIGTMSLATMAMVIIASRHMNRPDRTLIGTAVLIGISVMAAFFTPAAFLLVGACAGAIMVSQMALLARDVRHQGLLMGLYSGAGYLGMAVLPVIAGWLADTAGFFSAFLAAALVCLTAAALQLLAARPDVSAAERG